MLITLTPGDTGRRKDYFLSRIDSGGGPHRFKRWPPPRAWCGTLLYVTLCSVWGMDSRGGPHRFKRWPRHVSGMALCSVWHLVLFRIRRTLAWSWDTSSSSQHQACSVGRRYDRAINKSNSAGNMSTGDTLVQEYKSSGVPDGSSIIIMSRSLSKW